MRPHGSTVLEVHRLGLDDQVEMARRRTGTRSTPAAAATLCRPVTVATEDELIEFCREHNMKMLTVAELIRYRMAHERYVHRVGEALVGTRGENHRRV